MSASRKPADRILCLLTMAASLGGASCSRQHYHNAADREVTGLVSEKSGDPRWAVPTFDVEMDPRSRYYEPYNQDKPPMPPDDAVSHRLMHRVDGKLGYQHWHKYGDRPELENPWWREQLGEYAQLAADGKLKINLDSSVELGRIHSSGYQQNLETIYLSALDVSTERFRFDVQFLQSFSGNDTMFSHLGRDRAPPFGSDILSTNTDVRLSRQFATAGELLVGFANSTVWQFAGPDTHTTLSILNFSFVQPLLRAGGRAVALGATDDRRAGPAFEPAGSMQRYRQGFYTDIAVGEGPVPGPQRRGGFFGGTGLTGFSGTGAGGVGGVGEQTFRGGAGRRRRHGRRRRSGLCRWRRRHGRRLHRTAPGPAGNPQLEENLRLQLRTQDLLEEFYRAGDIVRGQVDQFSQNLETERANLLQCPQQLRQPTGCIQGNAWPSARPGIRPGRRDDPPLPVHRSAAHVHRGAPGGLSGTLGPHARRTGPARAAEGTRRSDRIAPDREPIARVGADRPEQLANAASQAPEQALRRRPGQRAGEPGRRAKALALADGKLAAMREGLSPATRRQTSTRPGALDPRAAASDPRPVAGAGPLAAGGAWRASRRRRSPRKRPCASPAPTGSTG